MSKNGTLALALVLVLALGLVGLSISSPAGAAPTNPDTFAATVAPELGVATTFRMDEAGHDVSHYPSCVGQINGTAHHSCGSLTGGPVGGLF